MLIHLKTLKQAEEYRYGQWAGNEAGRRYNKNYCAYEVNVSHTSIPRQCTRKNGYGSNGLYCLQHKRIVER